MSGASPELAYEHNGRRVSRARFYEVACDPRRSVAVEACAGAGKTWMLVSRILRALLAGAQPHEILAITFTKKAAGEMRKRLHEWLEAFSRESDAFLRERLVERGVAEPDAAQVAALRGLHARLLEAGRPVQVRTFHSWFAALLRNAPLAVLERLRLPANYELLERDDEAVELLWRRFHGAVAQDDAARADYESSVAAYGRSATQSALRAVIHKRVEFAFADDRGVPLGSVQPFGEQFPELAAFADPADAVAAPGTVRDLLLAAAVTLGRASAQSFSACGAKLEQAVSEGVLQDALDALLTQGGTPRKFGEKIVGIATVREAQELALRLAAAATQHAAWLHQQRMTRLARIAIAEFAQLKRERGWIDMNDVERAALAMLADPVLSGWVQERLDARTRHLLIDEFQDTNPLQWQALHSWLAGYAGAAESPSVFIVGDPKQSIYRFRRAEPQVFRAAQAFIAEGLGGDVLSCDHTHRNSPDVIEVVNRVMHAAQDEQRCEGFRTHTTESQVRGAVLRLPRIERDAIAKPVAGDALAWRDSLVTPRELPEEKLLALECRQAAAWVAARVASGTKPGAIMVLARKRDRLAAMEEALRELHVPAQQPERSDLCDAPEVKDLVALFDVLVSTSHDLSLARVLKSPLFGWDDEALVALALAVRAGAPATWYDTLQRAGAPAWHEAAQRLARWKRWVDMWPPHDALAAIYAEADVLARFGAAAPAALRPVVIARLEALLGAALEWNGGRYPTPYAFVRAMKAGGIDAPALQSADAVNLLTVHGAKGLEADIVLMVDADAAPQKADTMGVVVEWPAEAPAPERFSFIASESRPPPCHEEALAIERGLRAREELNMLYVAMTRARREIVLSAVAPRSVNDGSWWRRLEGFAQPVEPPAAQALQPAGAGASFTLAQLVPLPQRDAVPPPAQDSLESRVGQAMHRLLETMRGEPRFAAAQLRRVVRQFALDAREADRAAAMAASIAQGEAAWAWDEAQVDWHGNEVPLHHAGELLRLDRLVRRSGSGEWWVLDYKSAAQPQRQEALVAQLRRYREAVQAIHPGAAVVAAFLTPQGRVVRVP